MHGLKFCLWSYGVHDHVGSEEGFGVWGMLGGRGWGQEGALFVQFFARSHLLLPKPIPPPHPLPQDREDWCDDYICDDL